MAGTHGLLGKTETQERSKRWANAYHTFPHLGHLGPVLSTAVNNVRPAPASFTDSS